MASKKVFTSLDFDFNATIENVGRVDIYSAYDHISLEVRGYLFGQSSNIAQIKDGNDDEVWLINGSSIIEVYGKQKVYNDVINSGYSVNIYSGIYKAPRIVSPYLSGVVNSINATVISGTYYTPILINPILSGIINDINAQVISGTYHTSVLNNPILSGTVDCQSTTRITNLSPGTNPKDAINYNQLNTAISGVVIKSPVAISQNTVKPLGDYHGVIISAYVTQSVDLFQTYNSTGDLKFRINANGLALGDTATAASGLVPLRQVNVVLSGHTDLRNPHPLDRHIPLFGFENRWENANLNAWTFVASGTTPPTRYMTQPRYFTKQNSPFMGKVVTIDGQSGLIGNEAGCSYSSSRNQCAPSGCVYAFHHRTEQPTYLQKARIGFWGNDENPSANGGPRYGFWLEFDRSVSTTDWYLKAGGSGGIASVQASGFVATDDYQFGVFVFGSDMTLKFYKCDENGATLCATLSGTNLPDTGLYQSGASFWQMQKVAGTAQRPHHQVHRLGKVVDTSRFPLFP